MAVEVSVIKRCGFCNTGTHGRCAIGIKHEGRHEKYPNGIVWACGCTDGGCEVGRRKCAKCGNRNTSEIDPATWECFDIEGCKSTVTTRRESNPLLVQITEIREKTAMAKIEENKDKAEKVAKAKEPTFCLVTGEPTKGGKFKPGMDARYVSERVTVVLNANFTKKATDEQRAKMKSDGVSDTLIAKFDKSVGIAKDKAEKAKAAKAEKEAAKAEKAKEKATA